MVRKCRWLFIFSLLWHTLAFAGVGYSSYYTGTDYNIELQYKVENNVNAVIIGCMLRRSDPDEKNTTVQIPSKIGSCKVVRIEAGAFSGGTHWKSIKIPTSVTSIGNGAFRGCTRLKSITMPNSVETIGNSAFRECVGLESVNVGSSVKDADIEIGDYAFCDCTSLKTVTLHNGVMSMGTWAFSGCSSLSSISMPSSVVRIGERAFQCCENVSVHIADICAWCKVYQGFGAMPYAWDLYVDGVKVLDLVLPDGLISVGYNAFAYCESIKSLEVPSSVTSIEEEAFMLAGLKNVKFHGATPPTFGKNVFSGIVEMTIEVPAEKDWFDVYAADKWLGAVDVKWVGVQEADSLTVTPTSGNFEYQGGTGIVTIGVSGVLAWKARPDEDWLSVSPMHGVGSGNVTYQVAPYDEVAMRSGTLTFGDETVTVFQYGRRMKLSSNAETCDNLAHVIPLTVNALAETQWNVKPNVDWISVNDGASNHIGGDSLSLSVEENTSYRQRTGTVSIGTETFAITQTGRIAVEISAVPQEIESGEISASGIVLISVASDLPWIVECDVDWLSFPNGSSGTGGGKVEYVVLPNSTIFERKGVITIKPESGAGVDVKSLAITQPAATSTLSTTEHGYGADGGTVEVGVDVRNDVEWDIQNTVEWITVQGEVSRVGSGVVSITANANNTVSSRHGTIVIAGRAFVVSQSPRSVTVSCGDNLCFGRDGGTGSFIVTPEDGASWAVESSDTSWIVIIGDTSGKGQSEVRCEIPEYVGDGKSRTGTIKVGEEVVYVTQRPFDLSINPKAVSAEKESGYGEVTVLTGAGNAWNAIATVPWLKIVSGYETGVGDGVVRYTYDANESKKYRTGKIIVSGEVFALEQACQAVYSPITYVNLCGAMHTNPESYCEGSVLSFSTPSSRTGYTFTGWMPEEITPEMTGAQTITACWRGNSYQIAYFANGGTGTMTTTACECGKEVEIAANGFVRDGYVFKGWATEEDGDLAYEPGEVVVNLATDDGSVVRLYAVWEKDGIVTNVRVFSGYPWQEVVIGYTIKDGVAISNCGLEVTAKDMVCGKTYTCKTLEGVSLTPGSHVIKWKASADGVKLKSDNVVFTVRVVPHDLLSHPTLYCVIDLSGGATASHYPVTKLADVPNGGWTDEYKTTKLVLRRIEAGTFKMQNQYDVTMTKPFYMGVFEMTQKQYELVMGSNPIPSQVLKNYRGDERPVMCVSYNAIRGSSAGTGWPTNNAVDATSFLGKLRAKTGLSFDLPTESQWEYSCRAGTTSDYNNGGSSEEDLKKLGRYTYNSDDGKGGYSNAPTSVGSYLPNAWGLYDMHGNVFEWCLDWYQSDIASDIDPKGADSGSSRVKRGGGYINVASACVSSYRRCIYPSSVLVENGFRLALTIQTCEGLDDIEIGTEVLAEASSEKTYVDTTYENGTSVTGNVVIAYGSVGGLPFLISANGAEILNKIGRGSMYWVPPVSDEYKLVYSCDDVKMESIVFCEETHEVPTVIGDEGAAVAGDAETGFVIKPSEGKTAVEVTIPQGVDVAKVTVEVATTVSTVKPNGAKVKVVSGDADITEYLNVPAADGNGVVNLAKATVKEEIVREAMDPAKGAEIKLNAANPTLTTPNTRVGLFYMFSEGRTLGGMERSASKTGDGKPWSPEVKVKGGNSAFYSIGVGKGE